MPRKKYSNLKELKEAYESGEISKEDELHLDNDNCWVAHWEDQGNGEYDHDGNYFFHRNCFPMELLKEALVLLGIPHTEV